MRANVIPILSKRTVPRAERLCQKFPNTPLFAARTKILTPADLLFSAVFYANNRINYRLIMSGAFTRTLAASL